MKTKFLLAIGSLLSLLIGETTEGFCQGTAFTYQGRLNANAAVASGIYDLRFSVFDADVSGDIVAGPLTNSATGVTNGLFIASLDFGPGVFNGSARWLEIAVRTNGGSLFAVLNPRQPITPSPYALLAGDVASASVARLNLTGTTRRATGLIQIVNGFVIGATVTDGGSGYIAVPSVALNNTGGGSGAVITANLSGGQVMSFTVLNAGFGYSPGTTLTVDDPPNNAYQVFAGANYFSGITMMSNPANAFAGSFAGNGAGLTNVSGVLPWQKPSGTSVQASPNTGYLLTNDQMVTVALPVSPSVGDILRVSGGAGGWRISQNAGQLIAAALFFFPIWRDVASSADGTRLVAAGDKVLWSSTNSGAIWFPLRAPVNQDWQCVASSSDGSKLVAAGNSGFYTTGDSGVTWSAAAPPTTNVWRSVASSADGTRLVAVAQFIPLYSSGNSGLTWAPTSLPNSNWLSVACSSDGVKLVVVGDATPIFTSTNFGMSWRATTNVPNLQWVSVASSSDGTKLVAASKNGGIYNSTDSGLTWTATAAPVTNTWRDVACSADGSILVATASDKPIYTSANSGASWTAVSSPSSTGAWTAVTITSDGSKFVALAGVQNGLVGIFPSQFSAQLATTSGPSGYLLGGQRAVIELLYVGGGEFRPLSYLGYISAY